MLGFVLPHFCKWIAYGFGVYFLLGAAGMLFYSKVAKLALCERIFVNIPGVAMSACLMSAADADC
jgi:hypothetical protein